MRFSRICLVAWVIMGSAASAAECVFCDDIVEVNDVRGACFLSSYDAVLAEVKKTPKGHVQVNLAACEGLTVDDQRGGMGTIRDFSLGPTKFVFDLDLDRIVCLRDVIATTKPLSPVTRIDLLKRCPN